MYQELAGEFLNSIQAISCKEHQKHISALLKGERFVMMYLLKNGPSFPGKIAEDMGSSTANIAKILRNLEERKFVQRRADVQDRRKKKVQLSESGRLVIEDEAEQVLSNLAVMFEKMGEKDAKELVYLMWRIVEVTREIEEKDENIISFRRKI